MPSNPRFRTPPSPTGTWLWLFPATYLAHIVEELVADFPSWLRRISGTAFNPGQFLALNAAAWLVMCAAVLVARSRRGGSWLVPALGSAVAANAVLHLGGSLVTAGYSPGAVSAALLWVPLGALALRRSWVALPRMSFAAGVVAGLAGHAVVSLLALTLGG